MGKLRECSLFVFLATTVLLLSALCTACSKDETDKKTGPEQSSLDGGKADTGVEQPDGATAGQKDQGSAAGGSTSIDGVAGTSLIKDGGGSGTSATKDAATDASARSDTAANDSAARDSSTQDGSATTTKKASVTIHWWAQSCFTSSVEGGITVMNDPQGTPTIEPQVCLISHEHADHNAMANVLGTPTVFRTADGMGEHEAAGMTFKAVATFHDNSSGSQRGSNTVFVWEMEDIHFTHLGDLGHLLTDEQIQQIGKVDVLMIPVGGGFTIDGPTAVKVAQQLSPKVILPMHYNTGTSSTFLATIDSFLQAVPTDWTVEQPGTASVTVRASDLATQKTKVVVLKNQ